MRTLLAALIWVFLVMASPVWATTLNWTDNSTIEDGFAVEQLGPGGWTEIARVGKDVTIYMDGASLEGCYRVRAFKDVDGVDIFSAYSNTACRISGGISLTVS